MDLTPDERDYSDKLFRSVLDLVITFESGSQARAGLIRPHIIRSVLIAVAATVDHNCGLGNVSRDRCEAGRRLGSRYASILEGLYNNLPDAEWPKAVAIDQSKPN